MENSSNKINAKLEHLKQILTDMEGYFMGSLNRTVTEEKKG
jgi:hypothetical protein